eukprot:scaffold12269_cov41-Cyclotella_meneghiniana.AAC.1
MNGRMSTIVTHFSFLQYFTKQIWGIIPSRTTWVLHEWGSPTNYELTDEEGRALFTGWTGNMARVFFLTMTFAVCCNLSLALLSSILWFHAIVYGNRENFIFEARRLLGLRKALMNGLLLAVSPLGCPRAVITRKGREELEEQAKAEAEILTKKALHPINDEKCDDSDIGGLLKQAAINLGRGDYDVTRFEDRLEEDWLAVIEQLRHKTVEFLAKYMPFGLAEELH